jgi:hypothetical protein
MTGRGRATSALCALLLFALAVAGCAGTRATYPPLGSTPAPAGDATATTSQAVIGALGAAGLQASVAARPYRPPEGALLAAAPRTVLQAALPDDPGHGFIVIYALPSGPEALAAADDQAAYIASGVGRVNFSPDAHFVLRVVGSTVVFSWWSPGAALDPRAQSIEDALATVGDAVPVAG